MMSIRQSLNNFNCSSFKKILLYNKKYIIYSENIASSFTNSLIFYKNMKTEFEITFQDISHDDVRKKIQSLWGICIQEKTLMKRIVYRTPNNPENSYFRLRDEGNKITFTYKEIFPETQKISSVQEIEVEVSDFEAMKQMLELSGLKAKSFQESYRETWIIWQEVYCMLDEWPGLKPFIEIEADSEIAVKNVTKKLGFEYNAWVFWAIDELYFRELWISHKEINSRAQISFENPPKVKS